MAKHRLLRYFNYAHLKSEDSRARSKPFHDLAHAIAGDRAVDEAEKTAGLRKLMEAKDCVVRSHIPDPNVNVAQGTEKA